MNPSLPATPAAAPPVRQWRPWLLRGVILALVYFLLGRLGRPFSAEALPAAALWPPMGLGLAALLRWGPRSWFGLVAGMLALAAAAPSWPAALGFSAVEAAALFLATTALARSGFDARLGSRRDLGLLVGVGALACLLPAILAAARSAAAGGSDAAGLAAAFGTAWIGSYLGLLLVALPMLACSADALRAATMQLRWRATTLLAAALLATAAAGLLLPSGPPELHATLACVSGAVLALLVLRGGLLVATGCVLLLGLMAALTASAGIGNFAPAVLGHPFGPFWAGLAIQLGICLVVHALAIDLLSTEKRWLLALGGAGLGVAEWRSGRDEGRTSEQWRRLMGIESTSLAHWLSRLHDDDRPELQDMLLALNHGPEARARREIRVRDGEGWRWLDVQWLVVQRDGSGRATRLLATLSDTSDRHSARERQRLSAALFQHLHEGLLIADTEMRVLDANPAYTQILGVPRSELLGRVPSLLQPAPADPLLRQQRLLMRSSLRAHGHWRGEVVESRRDGAERTLQVNISTVKDDRGAPQYHVLVISDVTEQRQQRDRLERQANFDELTRLPNRARLQEMLAEAMRAAEDEGCLLAVCYLDLDRFKPVNDRFGHAAGDRLLVELAGRLRSALRSSDLWSDAAGRLGGDEFVLLLRARTMEEARLAVERVLRVVAQPYVVDPAVDPVLVTASMGATVYPIDRSDADTLLRHADHAMYEAKQAGRNGYQFFDPEHRRRTEERVMAVGRVQEALDNHEFVLYYQPKVDMRRGVVLGLEALLRWDHPQQGLIPPGQFLPLIEHTGLSSHVGDWVLGQALEHLAQWRRAGHAISVSVNVSARHLQEPDFALRLSELLARHAEPLAAALELEVLETAAHADIQATSALLARCRELGVRFALDDFGTGYSTLSYLKQLPVDVLKIDRSFVHHMLDDAQDRAIVEGVIGLARTFQCVVVAEGVESPAQARTLLDMGCNVGQGTGIAAPMPAAAVSGWIREYRGLFAIAAAPEAGPLRAQGATGE